MKKNNVKLVKEIVKDYAQTFTQLKEHDMTFTLKDGGDRAKFDGGMVRDTEVGKIRWDLVPDDIFFDCVWGDGNKTVIASYLHYMNTGNNYVNFINDLITAECGESPTARLEYYARVAEHMTKGAEKYGELNWQLGKDIEVHMRYNKSLNRHFKQWLLGERTEDHAAACYFNVNGIEYTRKFIGDR